ncbi:DUF1501 domain-containing protein [Nannocystis radixulma]|uniref:DUF1501 domain-containing protein n=1 Tax=Nannocystis radixulma TaxID=2995305 RepID=A0ABT5B4D4_9BACT|nr:DUF1501 domain-containing protein [Nannocystis radixulma]MDC0668530.1 DUF1501 domain-containing protein [Nannocystis radixulma]
MNRRSFLKIAAGTGLAVALPRHARAALPPYKGPFYVMISARGGWDPVYLCDPKPKGTFNRLYDYDPVDPTAVGDVHYADIQLPANLVTDPMSPQYLMKNADFFAKYASKLVVINGLNMETNNHDRGVVTIWSGRHDGGYPNFAALVAAERAPEHPLAFISGGGYSGTGSLIPVTRLNSVGSFRKLAEPNRINPTDPNSTATYMHADTFARVAAAQQERLAAFKAKQNLPKIERSAGELYLARGNLDALASVALPDALIDMPNEMGDLERMAQQTQLAMAAFTAGLAVGVNLELGGFDTHANHDTAQVRQLAKLLWGIDYVMSQAAAAGLDSNLIVMVGSDFGRGKGYNGMDAASGKDHWPVSSAMFLSGNPGLLGGGGRVIGGTTELEQLPIGIDPDTLELDESDDGIVLTAPHLHLALREMAGVSQSAAAKKFGIVTEMLPLFG